MAFFFGREKPILGTQGTRMKITNDLAELLRRTRLDPEEIAERFRFLDWQEEDAKRLSAAAQRMEPAQQAFVDHLYRHLERFTTPSALLRDRKSVV